MQGRILDQVTWTVCALMGGAAAAGLALTDFVIHPGSAMLPAVLCLAMAGLALVYSRWRPDERVALTALAAVQLILFTGAAAPLSYLVASAGGSLWDDALQNWDRWLGLDWRVYLDLAEATPGLGRVLKLAYISLGPQLVLIPILLGLTGRLLGLRCYTASVVLSGLVTVLISAAMPAMTMFFRLGLDPAVFPNVNPSAALVHVAEMEAVRSGSLRLLVLPELKGIVAFPSYHAALAAIFARALWSVPRLRWPGIGLNGAMIAATPVVGGHYFADVFAGVAMALIVMGAVGRLALMKSVEGSATALEAALAPQS